MASKFPVKINLSVSARDLPLRQRTGKASSTPDPYVKVSIKDNVNSEWKELGVSEHFINNTNPNWLKVFTIDWYRGTGQFLRFDVIDYDVLNKDDLVGSSDINLDQFVIFRDQEISVNLSSGGNLLVKGISTVSFKLSAANLPLLDPFKGKSDPYVECYWSYGAEGERHLFNKTKVVMNVEQALWEEKIEFEHHRMNTNQFITFKVLDFDVGKDDLVGEVSVDLDPFINARRIKTFQLSEKEGNNATLTVKLA